MKPKPNDPWFVKKLIALGACEDAIKYARKYRTFPAAWKACEKSGWLLWLIENGLKMYHNPEFGSAAHDNCLGCFGTPNTIRRRFPADRVSKALRKV